MPFANPFRNEVAITLAGQKVVLRSTFEAICEMEVGTDKGVMHLCRLADAKLIKTMDLATILAAGIRGYGQPQSILPEEAGPAIVRTGLMQTMKNLEPFFVLLLTAGLPPEEMPKGEAMPEGTMTGDSLSGNTGT